MGGEALCVCVCVNKAPVDSGVCLGLRSTVSAVSHSPLTLPLPSHFLAWVKSNAEVKSCLSCHPPPGKREPGPNKHDSSLVFISIHEFKLRRKQVRHLGRTEISRKNSQFQSPSQGTRFPGRGNFFFFQAEDSQNKVTVITILF